MVQEQGTAPTIYQEEEHPVEERLKDLEQEIQIMREESIWKKIKDFLVNFLIAIILIGIAWYFVGTWTIPIIIAMFVGTYFYTAYIYEPPGVLVAVIGDVEPNNPEAGVKLELWKIPKKVWNETKTYGLAIPVKSSYGHTYVAEEFNYDPQQKKIRIVFQWVHLSILNFLTNYKLFHTLRVITKTYAEQINTLTATMDAQTTRKAMEIARQKILLLQNEATGFGEKGKEDELKLWEELLQRAKLSQEVINKELRKNPKTGQIEIPEEETKMQVPEE